MWDIYRSNLFCNRFTLYWWNDSELGNQVHDSKSDRTRLWLSLTWSIATSMTEHFQDTMNGAGIHDLLWRQAITLLLKVRNQNKLKVWKLSHDLDVLNTSWNVTNVCQRYNWWHMRIEHIQNTAAFFYHTNSCQSLFTKSKYYKTLGLTLYSILGMTKSSMCHPYFWPNSRSRSVAHDRVFQYTTNMTNAKKCIILPSTQFLKMIKIPYFSLQKTSQS